MLSTVAVSRLRESRAAEREPRRTDGVRRASGAAAGEGVAEADRADAERVKQFELGLAL